MFTSWAQHGPGAGGELSTALAHGGLPGSLSKSTAKDQAPRRRGAERLAWPPFSSPAGAALIHPPILGPRLSLHFWLPLLFSVGMIFEFRSLWARCPISRPSAESWKKLAMLHPDFSPGSLSGGKVALGSVPAPAYSWSPSRSGLF